MRFRDLRLKLVSLVFAGLVAGLSLAATVRVGNGTLEMPPPAGMSRITPGLRPYFQNMEALVPPNNRLLAGFLPYADIRKAQGGEPASFQVYCMAQVMRKLEMTDISNAQFETLKATVDETAQVQFQQLKKDADKMFASASKHLDDGTGTNPRLSIGTASAPTVHYRDDTSIAFSTTMDYFKDSPNGERQKYKSSMTATYLLAKHRVLFLYCYAGPDGIAQTRGQSRAWANDIRAANR